MGKTTLLRIIDGLESASGGVVKVNGSEVRRPSKDCGYVFQRDNLLPWRTIARNVEFGLEQRDVPRAERRIIAEEYLELVGLKGFGSHYPHELSGGMQQRANLARALAIRPSILLMDEPFAALDAQTRELMQSELLRIWSETKQGSTVVFVTHQIDEAIFLADRVIVLGARPGSVRRQIPIELPRPRPLSIKRSKEFISTVDTIWALIERDLMTSHS